MQATVRVMHDMNGRSDRKSVNLQATISAKGLNAGRMYILGILANGSSCKDVHFSCQIAEKLSVGKVTDIAHVWIGGAHVGSRSGVTASVLEC